jgi:hypothetical protein
MMTLGSKELPLSFTHQKAVLPSNSNILFLYPSSGQARPDLLGAVDKSFWLYSNLRVIYMSDNFAKIF